MTRIDLSIHGGGHLDVHGSITAKRILLILSRESFAKDDENVGILIDHFASPHLAVARYESWATETARLIAPKWTHPLPAPLRELLKGVHLLFVPSRWRYFSKSHRLEIGSLDYRMQSLRELIRLLRKHHEVYALTRSAGGRVASLVADDEGITKLVCIGYPFKNPDEPPDSSRYAHLAALKTPFLILQGTRDVYGGREATRLYPFSPTTTIEFIDTDHGLAGLRDQWRSVLTRIDQFFFGE